MGWLSPWASNTCYLSLNVFFHTRMTQNYYLIRMYWLVQTSLWWTVKHNSAHNFTSSQFDDKLVCLHLQQLILLSKWNRSHHKRQTSLWIGTAFAGWISYSTGRRNKLCHKIYSDKSKAKSKTPFLQQPANHSNELCQNSKLVMWVFFFNISFFCGSLVCQFLDFWWCLLVTCMIL